MYDMYTFLIIYFDKLSFKWKLKKGEKRATGRVTMCDGELHQAYASSATWTCSVDVPDPLISVCFPFLNSNLEKMSETCLWFMGAERNESNFYQKMHYRTRQEILTDYRTKTRGTESRPNVSQNETIADHLCLQWVEKLSFKLLTK